MRIIVLAISILFSTWTHAQSTLPEAPRKETQLGILKALNVHKPELGMRILSVDGGSHVMMSSNGRYIVKGSLMDLWDGVHESQVIEGALTTLPASISPETFFVRFGKEDGLPLYAYVKYGCFSCDVVTKTLLSDAVTSKYNVHLMVLHNDSISQLVSEHIYCSDNKITTLKSIFSGTSSIDSSLMNKCKDSVAGSTPTAAGAQGVKALPFTYFPDRKYGVIGDVTDYL